jgi:hypothetical protein
MLTERRAELLALKYRLERRIAGLRTLFFWLLAIFNVLTDRGDVAPDARNLASATVEAHALQA